MFAKRLFNKATGHQHDTSQPHISSADLDPRMSVHYGIPFTSSTLAFDPIQRLLAIGTLDGRIKIIGGNNIEGLLVSSKQLPFKNLEFLQNQGYLVSVSNENDIQVWDLGNRSSTCCIQWESNVTAFSLIHGTHFMYVGDDNGLMSVLKYDIEEGKLLRLQYQIPASLIADTASVSLPNHLSIVGILPQPCTSGNRVIIAYENGLLILWDISEARPVLVRGYMDLQLKDDNLQNKASDKPETSSSSYEQEKEICSLCWASASGSVLAVGYIDGDILLWNTSSSFSVKDSQQAEFSSNNVVKLELSSGERRLPVIVLHWSPNSETSNDHGGYLFIYGGDEVGSEEVLTVLSVEWSTGIETLRCIARVDLSLNGSFADMILIPTAGPSEKKPPAALFVLTNPGQLHVYSGTSLSCMLISLQENKPLHAEQFPVVVPTLEPQMTVSKLSMLSAGDSKLLVEIATFMRAAGSPTLSRGTNWPVTGGVPCEPSAEGSGIERIYIAGYQDGSTRIWNVTSPVFTLLFVIEGEVPSIKVAGSRAPVSALDFCCTSMCLAIGNELGLVRVYKPCSSPGDMNFHFLTDAQCEVHVIHQEKGFSCSSAILVQTSVIEVLQFTNSGSKLAMGFECGQVIVIDLERYTVLFRKESISSLNSPIISVVPCGMANLRNLIASNPTTEDTRSPVGSQDGVLFILTKDTQLVVIDTVTGEMLSSQSLSSKSRSLAISMYVIGNKSRMSEETYENDKPEENGSQSKPCHKILPDKSALHEAEVQLRVETSTEPLLFICCEDTLYTLKSVIKGDQKVLHKVNLEKPCCWSTIFKTKEEKHGVAVLYQSGNLEIRSLPDLEVVGGSSLMSLLRWSFKTNMTRTMASLNNGQIVVVNGSELAFLSLLAAENDFRIPDSLPSLHDSVLAAAAFAAFSLSSAQKKKQVVGPGILGGIIKGLKGGKMDPAEEYTGKMVQQLESTFSRVDLPSPSSTAVVDQDVENLSIDDIEIDDPPVVHTSQRKKHETRDKETERQKLFDGASGTVKPRMRTPQEIRAQYRKTGDVSGIAADARNKLAERQEKLERISRRTQELESGAESFASMANELVKAMEARKWWQI
ncbi:hypothetical protein H6P81_006369 [Aristolochia fimbriata]|uniref:V-SNARE coiled-coil homology domain-containing protein n=1 Tax=Aristolochia fimbriata TaxID=158543 RepID=A0AAV7EX42_ARIFI|nr:hypothetical protein H6P81_006369 [Aristolochia fimbriata]